MSTTSNAAFDGLSHHSRANCGGFNETVTWWFGHPIASRVQGYHYPHGKFGKTDGMHLVETPKTMSWRHAALHATESYDGTYCVVGNHYMYIRDKEYFVQSESVIDCAIYDGWWDK